MHSTERDADGAVLAYLCSVLLLCGGLAWLAFKLVASPVVLVNAVDAYQPPARARIILGSSTEDREQLEKEVAELENHDQGLVPLQPPQAAMASVQRPEPGKKTTSKPAKKRVVRAPGPPPAREQVKRDLAWGRPSQRDWRGPGGFFFW